MSEGIKNQEILEKYDKESAYRKQLGIWGIITLILGGFLTLFHLYTAFKGSYPSIIQGTIHLGTALSLVFLFYPYKKTKMYKKGVPWYDAITSIISLSVYLYII